MYAVMVTVGGDIDRTYTRGPFMKDLGQAFNYMFKDPRWVSKLLIAAGFMLLSIVLIGLFVLVGYFIQLTQRVMRRELYPLPDWSDIGVKFVTGVKFAVVYFIYLLPILLLVLPILAIAAVSAITDQPDTMAAFVAVYMFGFTILVIPYSLMLTLLLPIITYRFALEEKISDALDIATIIREFRGNWENTLIVALITLGIESFAGIGIFALLIGIFFTLFYAYAVSHYLSGALYLNLLERKETAGVVAV